jgi:hypothetical protein
LAVVPVSCFRHQTDTDHSAKKFAAANFAIARIFLVFFFVFALKLRATNARIGLREQVAERARTQTLSQLSNLLFPLSEVE